MDKKKELCKIAAQILNVANECGKTEWIPCSERLPKRENEHQRRCTYLVTNAYGNVSVMKYEFCGDFGFVGWGTDRPHDIRIIAWMPLPAPYTESEVE